MYTLRFIFEDQSHIDLEFAQNYTKDELRKVYNQEKKEYKDYPSSSVTHIEIYRFEEQIFEFPTRNVGIFDNVEIIYNKIKIDEEYCKSLYQQMTDYFIHGKMYQRD